MAKKKDNTNLEIIAIVGIVAIVAIFVLYLDNQKEGCDFKHKFSKMGKYHDKITGPSVTEGAVATEVEDTSSEEDSSGSLITGAVISDVVDPVEAALIREIESVLGISG
tara:strand:- start:207 stop:533 length:327 start_codon:yes stop_codon:yes gene_type:complete